MKLVIAKVKQLFDLHQKDEKLLLNEVHCRAKTIWVLTQDMSFWQMIAHRQVFIRTEPNFDIGQL